MCQTLHNGGYAYNMLNIRKIKVLGSAAKEGGAGGKTDIVEYSRVD